MSSHFKDSGFYLRDPGSGVEAIDFPALKSAGFKALALNVIDFAMPAWMEIAKRAGEAGMYTLPWGRCRSEAKVAYLCDVARKTPSRSVIVNCEDELFDGDVSLECIQRETVGLDACLVTLPWVGTPPLDLKKVQDLHIHLELFPQESATSLASRDCRAHAFDAGASRVSFMFGAHDLPLAHEAIFPPRPRSSWVYTLDDCQQNWREYAPQGGVLMSLPYTGPLYGPSTSPAVGKPRKSKTAKALKLILHEAGFGDFPRPDQSYNLKLERTMRRLQLQVGISPLTGNYGRKSYDAVRSLCSAAVGGTFACTQEAEELIRQDAAA